MKKNNEIFLSNSVLKSMKLFSAPKFSEQNYYVQGSSKKKITARLMRNC